MKQQNDDDSKWRLVLAGILFTVSTTIWVRWLHFIFLLDTERLTQWIPDDGFYYLGIARWFARTGLWTFDGGESLTTGFHPLNAWVLAGVYRVFTPGAETFLLLGIILSLLLVLFSIIPGIRLITKSGSLIPVLAVAVVLVSRNVLLNSVSVMEWGWTITLSALYYLVYYNVSRNPSRSGYTQLFVCGFLLSFARTDSGLIALGLLLSSGVQFVWNRKTRDAVMTAVTGFAGAIAGVITVFLHNYLFTGQILQSSARMKSLWGKYYGFSLRPIGETIVSLFAPYSGGSLVLVTALVMISLGAGMIRFWRTSDISRGISSLRVIWTGSGLTIAMYLGFYSRFAMDFQNWYTANLLIPILLFLCLPFSTGVGQSKRLSIAAGLLLSIFLVFQLKSAWNVSSAPEWPHHRAMYHAGIYLSEKNYRVGSWNAGIVGYFQGGRVINLDGLVNNDVYDYVRRRKFQEYLESKDIGFVLDFENMIYDEQKRKRGGYDSVGFLNRLKPVVVFPQYGEEFLNLKLYRFDGR